MILSCVKITIAMALLCIVGADPCLAQTELRMEALNRYTIVKSDTVLVFYAVKPVDKIDFDIGKKYYWYIKDTIITTQAAADGKILHGSFRKLFNDKNLAEEGTFDNGLKDGHWKSWYPGGNLKMMISWDKGEMNGEVIEYGENGMIMKKGKMKDNKFNGYIMTKQANGQFNKEIYKNGERENVKDK
ncbi:MAG: hypothetical protein E6H07_13300 [Bacteroidetes bacterium]|nr:MAG: hypothetical protein E6H07_13300 [Bacteroidota bacterium]